MPAVTINGEQYDTEQLSDQAKQRIGSIQFLDRKISELRAELAALQTARNTYSQDLTQILQQKES